MMKDRIQRSAGLMVLDIFLQFLPGFMVYHCIAATGKVLLGVEDCFSLWNGLWLFLLTAGFYLFRYYFPKFWLFLVSHTIWLVLFCLILPQSMSAKVILTVIGIFRSLYGSIRKASRVNERGEKVDLSKVDIEATGAYEGCAALFSLFIALMAGDIAVIYPFLAEPVLFYLAYFLRTHLSGRRMYLEQYEHMSHFPLEHMKRTGYLVMGAYLLISLICLAAAASYRYLLSDTGLFIWLWEGIKQCLRFLGMIIMKLVDIICMLIPNIEMEEETAAAASNMMITEAADTSTFWMLLDQILRVGVFVILIVLLIAGAVYILLEWNRRFQRGKKRGNQVEEYEEIRETWKPREKRGRKRRSGIFFGTPEKKIRWYYIRAVKKAAGQKIEQAAGVNDKLQVEGIGRLTRYGRQHLKVDETLSPLELDQALHVNQLVADEETLRILYEKARYSGQPISKDMAVRAKAAAKMR